VAATSICKTLGRTSVKGFCFYIYIDCTLFIPFYLATRFQRIRIVILVNNDRVFGIYKSDLLETDLPSIP
jgi:hypothetical protein